MIIETPKDWWRAAAIHRHNFKSIARCYLPLEAAVVKPGRTIDRDGSSIQQPSVHVPDLVYVIGSIDQALDKQDHEKLSDILQMIWAAAPDHRSVHTQPGWSTLCDLLSEYWVFDEEDE